MHWKPSCETLARTHQQELTQTVGDFLQHVHTTDIQPDAATILCMMSVTLIRLGQSLPHAHRTFRLMADLIFRKHTSQDTVSTDHQLLGVLLKAIKTILP